jgi:histone arginine demethylase JMJD6
VHDPTKFVDTIERINVNDVTVEQFIEKFEKGHKPCIITGITDNWPANQEWQVKVSM